jgi:hypothetical protein
MDRLNLDSSRLSTRVSHRASDLKLMAVGKRPHFKLNPIAEKY